MIRAVLTGAGLALLLAGAALAQTKAPAPVAATAPPPIPASPPNVPPLTGWEKIRFGMTSKALVDAFPGAQWTEEAGIDEGTQLRTTRLPIEGADYDVRVILKRDRVTRVTLTKVLAPGMDEPACRAAFAPDQARLRKLYGAPTESGARGDRWIMGGGSRVLIIVELLAPDDGTPTHCVVTTGYYPPPVAP
ncbi:MAG: hypothetical protein JWP35_4353 [Caulobacter sp.]|nr:hypothetical protein [Caulobacter sp.]